MLTMKPDVKVGKGSYLRLFYCLAKKYLRKMLNKSVALLLLKHARHIVHHKKNTLSLPRRHTNTSFILFLLRWFQIEMVNGKFVDKLFLAVEKDASCKVRWKQKFSHYYIQVVPSEND